MDQSESRIFSFHSDDVTQNLERLVPSLMGFVRVRVRKREEIGMFFAHAGKKGFFGGVFNK